MGYSSILFDLDGTLTVPQHDFAAFKRANGLDIHEGILESVATMSEDRAKKVLGAVAVWEVELAKKAVVAPYAKELLAALHQRGVLLGIVTRNTHSNALRTLQTIDLASFFEPSFVIGRTCAPAKPSPQCVLEVLRRMNVAPQRALMVGDHRTDVIAAKEAGAAAAHLTTQTPEPRADYVVSSLKEVLPLS